jgi:3-hydroxyisobutyrate dehydrogenase-like beta-hydroxyacid dehydrogenase
MAGQETGHRLGWLGTGRMGLALARRLLAADCDLAVYNRTRAKAEPLAAHGAKIANSAADLADRDIVFATVGTPQDLLDAVLGPGGLLSGGSAPQIVVDCSTISVEASEQVRGRLAEHGTALLAAPVMGNPRVAEAGRLTLAVSGPAAAFETARPYLGLLGSGATYVGEGELARTVKICHNLFLGVVAQSMAEVTILAQKSGISREAFLACLNNSVMGSTFTRYKTPAMVNLDFHPTFTARLLRKDFDLGLAAARQTETPMPVAALVHQVIQGLVGAGYGDQDFAALIALEAAAAGVELAGENADISDGLDPADTNNPNAVR